MTDSRPSLRHYELHLSCPKCGAPVRPVAEGRPVDSGTEISAIASCTGTCLPARKQWQLVARLVPFNHQELHR